MIATKSDTRARIQFLLAISTPVPAKERPMRMMTGPITIGGNSFLMNLTPNNLTRKLISMYTSPTATSPQNIPDSP